ncbi:MAG: TRAP transporter large permease [Burkholderiaceae bacterium]|nr:TRAP transporter large permease [Burkholderiaceae bacterium]
MSEALLGLLAMFALSAIRVPIAFAMGIVGFFGLALIRGWNPALASAGTLMYETGFSYTLSVIPLFILMGNFVSRAGLSRELFQAAYAFIGHWRGGLAMSTIIACAGFGSICGSSIATAATMSRVAYPSMRSYGYSDRLATGSIAAGGTLGILIPPSVIMVIYALMTEINIGAMFAAGVIPGIIATVLLMLAVAWQTWRDPAAGPPGERTPWPQRWQALRGIWGVVVLFTLVMGGIYAGAFTVTEGAGIGAFGAFVFALARRALTWSVLAQVLVESARTTAMLFVILIGALIFANFVNFTSMPEDLRNYVEQFQVSPMTVIVLICVIYVLLGTAMEELSMILLTVPVLFPLVVHLGFDPLWFGILVVVVVEIGLISPPVGMNIFVLRTLLPHVSTGTIYHGVMPFVVADVIRLAILVAVPSLSTWLPHLLF